MSLISGLGERLSSSLTQQLPTLSPLMKRIVTLAALAFTVVLVGIALGLRRWAPTPPQSPPSTPDSSPPVSPRGSTTLAVQVLDWKKCETPANAPEVFQDLLKVKDRDLCDIVKGHLIQSECAEGLKIIAYFRLNGKVLIEGKGDPEDAIIRAHKALKKFEWSFLWRGELLGQALGARIFGDHLGHAQNHFKDSGLMSRAVTGPQADLKINGKEVEYSLTQIFKGIKHGLREPPHLIVRRRICFEITDGALAPNVPKNLKIEDWLSPEFPSLEKAQEFLHQHLLPPPILWTRPQDYYDHSHLSERYPRVKVDRPSGGMYKPAVDAIGNLERLWMADRGLFPYMTKEEAYLALTTWEHRFSPSCIALYLGVYENLKEVITTHLPGEKNGLQTDGKIHVRIQPRENGTCDIFYYQVFKTSDSLFLLAKRQLHVHNEQLDVYTGSGISIQDSAATGFLSRDAAEDYIKEDKT